MLTIVTGVPGAGKTLLTLERILKEFRSSEPNRSRPLFCSGIPDLNYDFFRAKELDDPDKWHECPDGSIIIVDEAQRVFPQRPSTIPVPQKCRQFETHRHRGFDVFLTTQDASTLDVHVRKLCGRHLHVHRILNRKFATVYEYDHFQSNPTGFIEKKSAISVSAWSYPKKLFDKYKSATMHTYKARTPIKLYLIPLIFLIALGSMYYGFKNVMGMTEDTGDLIDSVTGPGSFTNTSDGNSLFSIAYSVDPAARYYQVRKPVIEGVLHTAPIYEDMIEPKEIPVPMCITYDDDKSCKCYTQQMTTYSTTDTRCRQWASDGFYNPTFQTQRNIRPGGGRQAKRPSSPEP